MPTKELGIQLHLVSVGWKADYEESSKEKRTTATKSHGAGRIHGRNALATKDKLQDTRCNALCLNGTSLLRRR